MRKKLLWGAGILAVIVTIVSLIPAVRDECHWQWALFRDDTTGYEAYVRTWPTGRHALDANVRYDERTWTDAIDANAVEAFEQYILTHESGKHVAEATNRLAELRWTVASITDTAEAYTEFLESNPRSDLADKAIDSLITKKPPSPQDRLDYAATEFRDMHFAYSNFAKSHARSPLGFKASRELLKFGKLTAEKDCLVSVDDLRSKYNWDGLKRVWQWSDEVLSGIQMRGGSVVFLSKEAVDPIYGIPFHFGFGGDGFGKICIGNLQIEGRCRFEKDGLRLYQSTTLIYPLQR